MPDKNEVERLKLQAEIELLKAQTVKIQTQAKLSTVMRGVFIIVVIFFVALVVLGAIVKNG